MKFVSAYILFAVAIAAEASVWGPSLSVSGPLALGAHGHGIHVHDHHWAGPVVADHHHWGAPIHTAVHAIAPAHIAVHAAHHDHGHHSGAYVAANRGSVHSVPLPGHISSVKSVNTDPAPGTTW